MFQQQQQEAVASAGTLKDLLSAKMGAAADELAPQEIESMTKAGYPAVTLGDVCMEDLLAIGVARARARSVVTAFGDPSSRFYPPPKDNYFAMTQSELARALAEKFSLNHNQGRIDGLAMRDQPIAATEVFHIGRYLSLGAYGPALDRLARALMRMHRAFDTQAVPIERFLTTAQLLLLVGGPGLGKSTFAQCSWSLLRPRLEEVKHSDSSCWQRWQQKGVDGLLLRLKSWDTKFGPLVFTLDMSQDGLRTESTQEEQLPPAARVAARMLFAAVEPGTWGVYSNFLATVEQTWPRLLSYLTPLVVQYFVHMAAGLDKSASSLVAFVFDEVNAAQMPAAAATGEASFVQRQLSDVVCSRQEALRERRAGAFDVLLVPVAVSTRGSALSLASTASKKAGWRDLRLPLLHDLDLLKLITMDFLRRLPLSLPLPPDLARKLSVAPRTTLLASLSREVQQQLAASCPLHVVDLLKWTGGNPRVLEASLGVLSGQSYRSCEGLNSRNIAAFGDAGVARSLDALLEELVAAMMQRGWDRWLTESNTGWASHIMLQAVAYGVCDLEVSRGTMLHGPPGGSGSAGASACDGNVTLQVLEADGMVELHLTDGTLLASPRSSRSEEDLPPATGAEAAACPAAATPSTSSKAAAPAAPKGLRLAVPPLFLLAFLQQLARASNGTTQIRLASLMPGVVGYWRGREWDDLGMLTLRLQLLHQALGWKQVQLRTLLRPLADEDLGQLHVLVPDQGFGALQIDQQVKRAEMEQLVSNISSPDRYSAANRGAPPPWAVVFNGNSGLGDSMLLLQHCDQDGHASGDVVAINIQGKLRRGESETVTWSYVEQEAAKVPKLGSVKAHGKEVQVHQLFLFVSDQRPKRKAACSTDARMTRQRTRQERAGPSSAQTQEAGAGHAPQGCEMEQLAEGRLVRRSKLPTLAVFRDDEWLFRGAMKMMKRLLEEASRHRDKVYSELARSSFFFQLNFKSS